MNVIGYISLFCLLYSPNVIISKYGKCFAIACYILQIWHRGAIIDLTLLHLNLKSPNWQILSDPPVLDTKYVHILLKYVYKVCAHDTIFSVSYQLAHFVTFYTYKISGSQIHLKTPKECLKMHLVISSHSTLGAIALYELLIYIVYTE